MTAGSAVVVGEKGFIHSSRITEFCQAPSERESDNSPRVALNQVTNPLTDPTSESARVTEEVVALSRRYVKVPLLSPENPKAVRK